MSDEEILRSAGLILKDTEKQREGITLAAILLFGIDITILSALPQHKTHAIFRVENLDRDDDRDVIITNLFETYDRLIKFGKKHLSDPFVLEGIYSVSVRDKILREIFLIVSLTVIIRLDMLQNSLLSAKRCIQKTPTAPMVPVSSM